MVSLFYNLIEWVIYVCKFLQPSVGDSELKGTGFFNFVLKQFLMIGIVSGQIKALCVLVTSDVHLNSDGRHQTGQDS